MNRIAFLKNPVQPYAWGSKSAIQDLLGMPDLRGSPVAEVWMGSHPKAPSNVFVDGSWINLGRLIEKEPESILGRTVSRSFQGRLPFLFKILAADSPLSIQVHPNRRQALEGFARENRMAIPVDSPQRSYRDGNPKPELLCALTPFHALKGFREIDEILSGLGKVASQGLGRELEALKARPNPEGLKCFFSSLMRMEAPSRKEITDQAADRARIYARKDNAFSWVVRLQQAYPGDVGVLSPLILNYLLLQPGKALYIGPGDPHVYLRGMGLELMGNSDNVLRGGLTRKHVDVEGLLKVVRFHPGRAQTVEAVEAVGPEKVYPAPAEEFRLSVIGLKAPRVLDAPDVRSAEIAICLEGSATIMDLDGRESLILRKGRSLLIPAAAPPYRLLGNATLYKATVPLTA